VHEHGSISNYLLSLENFQIYESFIDRKSNAWFTLNSENETMVDDTKIFFRSTSGHGVKITELPLASPIPFKKTGHVLTIICQV